MCETEAIATIIDVRQAALLVEGIVREGVGLLFLDEGTRDATERHAWICTLGESKVYRASIPLAGDADSLALSANGFLTFLVGDDQEAEDGRLENGAAFLYEAKSGDEPMAFLLPGNARALAFLESLSQILDESGITLYMGTFSSRACAPQQHLHQLPIIIEARLEHVRETMWTAAAVTWGGAD